MFCGGKDLRCGMYEHPYYMWHLSMYVPDTIFPLASVSSCGIFCLLAGNADLAHFSRLLAIYTVFPSNLREYFPCSNRMLALRRQRRVYVGTISVVWKSMIYRRSVAYHNLIWLA